MWLEVDLILRKVKMTLLSKNWVKKPRSKKTAFSYNSNYIADCDNDEETNLKS